jgi:hypothetical protein
MTRTPPRAFSVHLHDPERPLASAVATLIGNGADVVRPVGFTPAAGGVPGTDRAAAAHAGSPGRVGKVIFPGVPVRIGEVFALEPLALTCGIALQR